MRFARVQLLMAAFLILAGAAASQAQTAEVAAEPAGEQEAPQARDPKADLENLRHLRINREAGYIELDAEVILREGEWLELLACTAGTREHESILVVQTQPRMIHLALLLIGAKPGSPIQWTKKDDTFVATPPSGDPIQVTLHYERDGKQVVVPAHEWITDQKRGGTLPSNIWLFAGSAFREWNNQQIYMADTGGTVLSLVNFGDDLLTRPTLMTDRNDDRAWGPRTEAIPAKGTPVVIRLTPVRDPAEEPETSPERSDDTQPASAG